MIKLKGPVVLVILDGWGILPSWGGNPVSLLNPGFMSYLWQHYPHQVLEAFSLLDSPYGGVGSSEIGYTSIGAGRMVQDPLTTISRYIQTGEFFHNKAILGIFQHTTGAIHLVGILTKSGVHSHLDHLEALVKFAASSNVNNLYLHAILDGVDMPPRSGYHLLEEAVKILQKAGIGRLASFCGRNYAMDPLFKSQKVAQATRAIVNGQGHRVLTWQHALIDYYKQELNDPIIPATVLEQHSGKRAIISPGDGVILFNSRFDKTRLLAQALAALPGVGFVSFVNQIINIPHQIAFPLGPIQATLSEGISRAGLSEQRITESLKGDHLKHFFAGKFVIENNPREDIVVPSQLTDNFSKTPSLKAKAITDQVIKAIDRQIPFIVAAYANPDVLGHVGDLDALRQGIDVVQDNLEKIYRRIIDRQGIMIISADHGNAEAVLPNRFDWYGQRHTTNPVPFLYITAHNKIDLYRSAIQLQTDILSEVAKPQGSLADIAPTILDLFGIAKPTQMTGKSLLDRLK